MAEKYATLSMTPASVIDWRDVILEKTEGSDQGTEKPTEQRLRATKTVIYALLEAEAQHVCLFWFSLGAI